MQPQQKLWNGLSLSQPLHNYTLLLVDVLFLKYYGITFMPDVTGHRPNCEQRNYNLIKLSFKTAICVTFLFKYSNYFNLKKTFMNNRHTNKLEIRKGQQILHHCSCQIFYTQHCQKRFLARALHSSCSCALHHYIIISLLKMIRKCVMSTTEPFFKKPGGCMIPWRKEVGLQKR